MSQQSSPLPAECLHIEGADALSFAHAQFSSDVRALQDGHWQWSAWLDARGKVRALLHLLRVDQTHLLALLRGGLAQTMADALRPFVMRSKLTLRAQATGIVGTADFHPMHSACVTDNEVVLGCDGYALGFAINATATSTAAATQLDDNMTSADLRLAAIRAGHPWLPDGALGRFVPQALSLERLGAVSFSKGCFPGQEIAARLHYRGGPKKHLYGVTSESAIATGAVIRQGGHEVGLVLDAVTAGNGHTEALVVLNDEAASAPATPLPCVADPGGAIRVAQAFGA